MCSVTKIIGLLLVALFFITDAQAGLALKKTVVSGAVRYQVPVPKTAGEVRSAGMQIGMPAANGDVFKQSFSSNDPRFTLASASSDVIGNVAGAAITFLMPGGFLLKAAAGALVAGGVTAALDQYLRDHMGSYSYNPTKGIYEDNKLLWCGLSGCTYLTAEDAATSKIGAAGANVTGGSCIYSGAQALCSGFTVGTEPYIQTVNNYSVSSGLASRPAPQEEYEKALSELEALNPQQAREMQFKALPDTAPMPAPEQVAITPNTETGLWPEGVTIAQTAVQGDTVVVPDPNAVPDPQGNTVTQVSTSTTVTTNPDGSKTTSQTDQSVSFTDIGFGEIPTLWERKYEDGFVGVLEKHAELLQGTKLGPLLTAMTTGIGSSGFCPSWVLNVNLGKMGNFGSGDLAPPCSIWPYLRAIILVSALLLARRLVFGG